MTGTANDFQLRQKYCVTAVVVFDTAWRIGSGHEGETMSDLGIVLDPMGQPLLPGASLKGKLRSTCETLAYALNLTACLLDREASHIDCVSDVEYHKQAHSDYQRQAKAGLKKRLDWIDQHTCDVCKLFGSPIRASHIRVSDGQLEAWANVIQVRDGVVIDRDSHTAVDGLKYDYEVVPATSRFRMSIDVENPREADLALLGAALFDWHSGSTLGGFTSRGLGRFHLEDIQISGVDLSDPKQRVRFLTATSSKDRLADLGDWEAFFSKHIQQRLEPVAAKQEA